MERRQALKFAATIIGSTIIGAESFLSYSKGSSIDVIIPEKEVALYDEIAEIILPDSDRSPGAKAANVGLFIKLMVSDCYKVDEQMIFFKGIEELEAKSIEQYGKRFIEIDQKEKHKILAEYDHHAKVAQGEGQSHWFIMVKQLTILGYFSSKIGATEALRYNPEPGGYDGCIKYIPGTRAWYGPLSSIG